jgi:hypothetical protein
MEVVTRTYFEGYFNALSLSNQNLSPNSKPQLTGRARVSNREGLKIKTAKTAVLGVLRFRPDPNPSPNAGSNPT